jgi:hypothetical protein
LMVSNVSTRRGHLEMVYPSHSLRKAVTGTVPSGMS